MTTFVVVISTLNLLLGYALAIACQRWSQSAGAASSAASLEAEVGVASRPAAQPAGVESPAEPAAAEQSAEPVAAVDAGEAPRQTEMTPMFERLPSSLPNRLSSTSAVPPASAGADAPAADETGLDLQRFREDLADLGRELRGSLGSEADDECKEQLKQLTEARASAELFESAASLLRPTAPAPSASTSDDEQRPDTGAEAALPTSEAAPDEVASAAAPRAGSEVRR